MRFCVFIRPGRSALAIPYIPPKFVFLKVQLDRTFYLLPLYRLILPNTLSNIIPQEINCPLWVDLETKTPKHLPCSEVAWIEMKAKIYLEELIDICSHLSYLEIQIIQNYH